MELKQLEAIWRELPQNPAKILMEWAIKASMAGDNKGGTQNGWKIGACGRELRICDPNSVYRLDAGAQLGVSVIGVPMIGKDDDITAQSKISLPSDSDAKVCVTPLLSGCSVGIKKDGSEMFHKQPPSGGVALQKELTSALGGDYRIVGATTYCNANYCAVIGFKKANQWEFWMQKQKFALGGFKIVGVSKLGLE